jgi:hypothetical protein
MQKPTTDNTDNTDKKRHVFIRDIRVIRGWIHFLAL